MLLEKKYQEIMYENHLFKDLLNNDFSQLVEKTTLCELKKDEVLFRQQQPAVDFFLLLSGKIKLSLLSADGTEKVVDIINAGHTFAEAVILQGMPGYPVNAEALSDVSVLRIKADIYTSILHKSPETCIKVMACLSMRLHWLVNELDRLSLHNATFRLVSYLLENIAEGAIEQVEVNLSVPKHVIASRISVTPETLSRTLKRLNREGFLEVYDSHIIIKKPAELRNLVAI